MQSSQSKPNLSQQAESKVDDQGQDTKKQPVQQTQTESSSGSAYSEIEDSRDDRQDSLVNDDKPADLSQSQVDASVKNTDSKAGEF